MSADGIDEAAAAFTKDIAAETPTKATPKPDRTEGPPERMFERVGELEVDEDSPARAPGDDDETPPPRTTDDEEEGEEADEPDEEESEEADEEAEPNAEFLSQEVAVVVDGQEQTVTLKEALEGYVRTQTFHKRMSEVDEAKKIISRTAADAVDNYNYSMEVAKQIHAHLEALVPPEPNWDEEFKKNPARAREMQKYYDHVKGFRVELNQRLSEAAKKQQESDAVQLQAYADAEARKFDQANSRNWATDPKKKTKDLQAMRRTALTHGFSEEEISQVYDSRMLNVLLKASKYDRMMAARPKPVNRGATPRPVPSGGGPARTKKSNSNYVSAAKKLSKTGSIDDAAMVFDTILRREDRGR